LIENFVLSPKPSFRSTLLDRLGQDCIEAGHEEEVPAGFFGNHAVETLGHCQAWGKQVKVEKHAFFSVEFGVFVGVEDLYPGCEGVAGEFGRETTMVEGVKASLMLDSLGSEEAVVLLHF